MKKAEENVGRQHQGMDRPGVHQVPEGSGEQRKMEKTGSKIICGVPTTLVVKELMMMMMSSCPSSVVYRNTKTPSMQRRLGSATLSRWLSPGKATRFPMGEIPFGQYSCKK